MTTKFRGKYAQILPHGSAHLLFRKSGNHYTWNKPITTVHNVIVGKLWIDSVSLGLNVPLMCMCMCMCACVRRCVRAWVRACVRARMRTYAYSLMFSVSVFIILCIPPSSMYS